MSFIVDLEVAYTVAEILRYRIFVLETASKEPFIVQEQSG